MAEDVFLGLGDKDPSSAHCEAMLIRIECPQHTLDDLELDLQKQKLRLDSMTLHLVLPLPYPVRSKDAQATWDSSKQVLRVSVPILRDEW